MREKMTPYLEWESCGRCDNRWRCYEQGKVCAALSTKQEGEECLSGRDAPSDEYRRALEDAAVTAETCPVWDVHWRRDIAAAIRALKHPADVAGEEPELRGLDLIEAIRRKCPTSTDVED